MAVFNEPQKWAQTLGQDADVVSIPDTAGETDPSIDKIFPSVFSIPLSQGGRAIPRSVLNGLLKLLGDWIYYVQNGGISSYSNTFDYAVGSFVRYNNEFYRCIQANGASTELKVPTETAYWSKITTLADISNAFANQDLSNLSASGQAIIDNKADISFSNVNNTANILMAHNAMPSNVHDTLTFNSPSTSYTAPADGYFYVNGNQTGYTGIGNIRIQNTSNDFLSTMIVPSIGSSSFQNYLPTKKGSTVTISTNNCNITSVKFYFAVGSESEQ